jgi:hypothetical protein
MKTKLFNLVIAICGLIIFASAISDPSLEEGFVNPSSEYGPRTWWHWLNENITKDGITKDLEAMQRIGYKGAHMVNLPQGGAPETHGDDVVGSPVWLEKVEHAAKECERLGLTLGMASSAGFGSGGPWITPELSMQDIVWRHTFVTGPVYGTITLPQPRTNEGYYRDIAVLAYPTLPGEAVPVAALNPTISSDFPEVDWSALIDGDPETFITLPAWTEEEKSRFVAFEFDEPVPVRSLSLELHENARTRVVKMYASDDGQKWVPLLNLRYWQAHLVPGRVEMIDGFAERRARYIKLEFVTTSPPVKLYEFNFQSARLSSIHTKAARQRTEPPVSDPSRQVVKKDQRIQVDRILDLTENLQPNGELECELPEGEWTIIRFGHTSNGNEIRPASERAKGLESDKMSVEALKFHLDKGVVRKTIERLGPLTGKVMVGMNVDSWEASCQTWTKKFPEEFSKRRGYEMGTWLIALTGRFVDNVDKTDRFLWDYRRTIGDLIAENFYGEFQKYCNKWGVYFESEAPGIGIPIQVDQIQCLGMLDIPQGEFWLGPKFDPKLPHWFWGGHDNTKEVAVAGHVYGKEIISCEAFTSFGRHDGFTQYPYILKPVGDRQFCKGMNEIVFHRYAHQPDDRFPGMSLGEFGLNLERTQTWWKQGHAWVSYIKRCQFMLRQGRFFADVCYYYGEDVPGSAWYYTPNVMDPRQKMKPVLPPGYDYDVCDRTTFDLMRVEDGLVVLPSGMRYSYLVLPEHARYTPAALEKVYELVTAGATVIGPEPSRSPSMNDYPNADNKIQELARKLWPEVAGPGERRVGKGRVVTGKSFETIFAEDAVKPDFNASLSSIDSDVRYIHRKIESGDMYFVASQQDYPEEVLLQFRVSGKIPEIWDPMTGERSFMPMYHDNGETTTVSLRMENYDSRFILFRKPTKNASVIELRKDDTTLLSVSTKVKTLSELSPEIRGISPEDVQLTVWTSGEYELIRSGGEKSSMLVKGLPYPKVASENWTVTFQQERGAPEGQVSFEKLESWTQRPEDGIKYFSGTATYEQVINISRERLQKGRRVHLDLGDVKYLAEVFVNDQPLGVLWKPPFQVDITETVKAGSNKVQVKITNVWKNRLIKDAQLPKESRVTWSFYPFYENEPDAPLMESGLLGPVRVLSSVSATLK